MSNKTTSIRISEAHKNKLKELADSKNVTSREMIEKLIDGYQESESTLEIVDILGLREDEIEEVKKAELNTKTSTDAIAKEGLIQRVRYLNNIHDTNFDNTPREELRTSNLKGIAEYKIRLVIDTIKEHNVNSSEPKERIFITPNLVQKISGSNFNTVKK